MKTPSFCVCSAAKNKQKNPTILYIDEKWENEFAECDHQSLKFVTVTAHLCLSADPVSYMINLHAEQRKGT